MQTVLASRPATTAHPDAAARIGIWVGRSLTGLLATALLVDAIAKLIPLAPVVEATTKLGFHEAVIRPFGIVLAASTILHVVPRTQLFGAVLLTAYLGGATATHVHVGTPFWFPVVMGVILWIAYGLRSPELRTLILSRR